MVKKIERERHLSMRFSLKRMHLSMKVHIHPLSVTLTLDKVLDVCFVVVIKSTLKTDVSFIQKMFIKQCTMHPLWCNILVSSFHKLY